jgi:hypothetical protein
MFSKQASLAEGKIAWFANGYCERKTRISSGTVYFLTTIPVPISEPLIFTNFINDFSGTLAKINGSLNGQTI